MIQVTEIVIKSCRTNKDQLEKNKQMIFIQNFLCKEISYYELHVAETRQAAKLESFTVFKKCMCEGVGRASGMLWLEIINMRMLEVN